MRISYIGLAAACCLSALSLAVQAEETIRMDLATVERGRYLLTVSGCNDCHTHGYAESGGTIPESERFLGSSLGFKGPWGTTYPSNLRLLVADMDESQWLAHARKERRPPMPWFNLRDASDADLQAMYHYLRHLGPKGEASPAYVAPAGKVKTAFILFVPQQEAER